MTGAPGITTSTPPSQADAGAKPRPSKAKDNEGSVLNELRAFAELFYDFAQDGAAPSGDAASHDEQPDPDEAGDDSSALKVAATHSEWFGGETPEPVETTEKLGQRKTLLTIRVPEESGELRLNDEAGAETPPPDAVDLPLPGDDVAVAEDRLAGAANAEISRQIQQMAQMDGELRHRLAHEAQATSGDHSRRGLASDRPDAAELPLQAKLTDREAMTLQAAAAAMRPAAAGERPGSPMQGKDRPMAKPGNEGVSGASAKFNASLSALEAILAREAGNGPKDANISGREASEATKSLRDAGISSVRQETHFAPGGAQSLPLQIAQRITHELQTGARGMDLAQQAPSGKAPVRVLQIQLDPPRLGPLTIRMSMHNDALRLQLDTPNYETARLIAGDREALSGLLRSAGYMIDGLNVQVTSAERGVGGQTHAYGDGAHQAAGQSQGWRQSDGRSFGRGSRGGPQGEATRAGGQQHEPDRAGRSRGGVYL